MTTEATLPIARRSAVGLFVFAAVVPYAWFAATSFKTPVEITTVPPTFWPSWTLEAFRSALVDHGLLRYVANSIVVAAATTVATLAIATPAGYALARLPLPGRRVLLALSLLTVGAAVAGSHGWSF